MDPYNQSSIIDMDSPSSQLEFQSFSNPPGESIQASPQYPFSPPLPEVKTYTDEEMNRDANSWLAFEYYQKLFDVNTVEVVERIKWSMLPKTSNYLQRYIKGKPDLYGPFWICITLIFSVAISGNIANYFQTSMLQNYHWKYDFHAVTVAATFIILYAWILPSVLWSYLKWSGTTQAPIRLLEVICVYGYCLSIFVPISILWVIQISGLQWLLMVVGASLSGSVLAMALFPACNSRVIALAIFILHFGLAIGIIIYFYNPLYKTSGYSNSPHVFSTPSSDHKFVTPF